MHKLTFYNRTTGRKYFCNLRVCVVDAKGVVPYSDYNRWAECCKTGCKNYANKWSCPPFSPSYTDVYKNEKYLYIFVLCMNLDQFIHIKNSYLKLKAANVMMKSRIDKFLRARAIYGQVISTGSCRLCKICNLKINEPCKHPNRMAFSFEALGIDVSAMTMELCQHKLLWYSKGNPPTYTTVVAGLLTNQEFDIAELVSALQQLQ